MTKLLKVKTKLRDKGLRLGKKGKGIRICSDSHILRFGVIPLSKLYKVRDSQSKPSP